MHMFCKKGLLEIVKRGNRHGKANHYRWLPEDSVSEPNGKPLPGHYTEPANIESEAATTYADGCPDDEQPPDEVRYANLSEDDETSFWSQP